MQGVGPGTVLGGRYTVQRRLEQRDGAERWSGHDDTLRRDVTLLVVPATHPQADALLDAARRAAGVDNSHLVRILDVGRADGAAYVVEEDLASAQTLSSLAARGGLPAEEVRRMVGIASRALEGARLRGLHHEAITPESVVRTPDGEVKILGLATAAALAGREGSDPDTASRTDAVSVVALTYAGLTGRWPLASDAGGLPPAPRFIGGVAAPSEIAAGVPQDLDTLCRQTLVDNHGPTTPGDFARQIAPWSHEPVGDYGTGDNTSEQDGGSAARTQVLPTLPPSHAGLRPAVLPPTAATPLSTAQPTEAVHQPDGPVPVPVPTALTPIVAVPAATAGPESKTSDTDADVDVDHTLEQPAVRRFPTHPEERQAGAAAVVAAALGGATAAAGQAVGAVSGRVGDLARTAADRAHERRAAKAAAAEWTEEHRVPLAETLESQPLFPLSDPSAPTSGVGPLIDPDAVEPLTRDESKLALAIVAGLLLLALVIGIYGVSQLGQGVNLGLSGDSTQTTLATKPATPKTTTGASSSTSTSTSSPAGQPITVLGIKSFDPLGDGTENESTVGRIIDGNPSTVWTSGGYGTTSFGGLKKGLGVILDLGTSVHPSSVTVTETNASSYTLYLADSRSLAGATEAGSSTGSTDPTTIQVPADAKGRYLIVWFTKVAVGNGGWHRAQLAEVKVSG